MKGRRPSRREIFHACSSLHNGRLRRRVHVFISAGDANIRIYIIDCLIIIVAPYDLSVVGGVRRETRIRKNRRM